MSHPIVQDTRDGAVLMIQVQPKASKSECVSLHGDALKIRIAAPPVDGKANEALIAFLAERLDIAPSSIEIRAGASGRQKRVLLRRCPAHDVAARLGIATNASEA
jgi:uncharacterized protein (TIGR00251 family)